MNVRLPSAINRVIEKLARLPSIGPRQATRLAFYLLGKGQNEMKVLAQSIDELSRIKTCARCFFVHENSHNLCNICSDKSRRVDLFAIVERETDLISLENTKKFNGRYFILGPISKTGLLEDWQKLRVQGFKSLIAKDFGGKVEEIILAFSPTSNGDFNASILIKELSPITTKITRLGRGLPTGGEIEFADDETLGEALSKRS